MSDYISREAASADSDRNKIKTPFARIVVEGTPGKPYYNIWYFDPADGAMHGYHPPIQADVEGVEAQQGISKICPQCGKEFTQGKIKQKIYCSLECQKAHVQRAAQRRYRARKAAADAG